ncbi:MAG: exodeoxyribonuclease VII small subunit [Alphaproteobacteria bacterium]|nr:exodeoxyribonuclease VII small subunit [Alphaproteobacteria bacterium]
MAKDSGEARIPDDIAKLTFEQALAELEAIVRRLETGEAALDKAIDDYERGAHLKRYCEDKLRQAQARVERIALAPDGTPGTEPAGIG